MTGMPEHPPTIPERIAAVAGEPPSEGIPAAPDSWRSPEDGAEQLYALWRDYNRRKVGVYRRAIAQYRSERQTISPPLEGEPSPIISPPPPEGELEGVAQDAVAMETPPPPTPPPGGRGRDAQRIPAPDPDRAAFMAAVDADPSLTPLREAIRLRFRAPDVRQAFERNLERILASEEHIQPTRAAYAEERQRHDTARTRELDIYRDIFTHRDREPDELSLLELADLHARIIVGERRMADAVSQDPEFAARLSFERLRGYAAALRGKSRFCMTPSRERAIAELLHDAVILNRNRPLVLVGETGTGKTEVVRALSRLLTGQEPARTTARDQGDPDRTLGFRAIEIVDGKEKTTVAYGTIGQALTGKRTALDASPGPGAIAFLDEGNKYPESFIRMLVKTLAGREPGESVTFDAWYGEQEPLAAQSLLVLGMNLPDPERGRHLDRQDFSPELKREFAPTTHRLEYIPQDFGDAAEGRPPNPELFEILLAACMDRNDRIRIPRSEVSATTRSMVESGRDDRVAVVRRRYELDQTTSGGGALWRLANLIAATQRRYTEARTAGQSSLEQAVLDVGVAVSWLQAYQKTELRKKSPVPLQRYLAEQLAAWAGIAGKPSGQTLFRKEDREALAALFREFRLDAASATDANDYPAGKRDPVSPLTILSPSDIGALSPRVPRAPEFLGDTPDATTANATLEDGTIVKYRPHPLGDVRPGTRFQKLFSPSTGGGAPARRLGLRSHSGEGSSLGEGGRGGGTEGEGEGAPWTFKGLTLGDAHTPADHAVLEGPDGIAQVVAPDALTTAFERERSREISYDAWSTELDAFARSLNKPFAEGERNIEALIQRQEQFYRDQYRDLSFTIDRAHLTLTRERLDAWKAALERGEADYPLVVAPPRALKPEERPRTLHRVLFDRLIREGRIKIWERADPTVDEFLDQVRDLTLEDLTRTDLKDSDGNTLAFDKDHWPAYLQALYPTLPRPDVTTATPTIGFVKWEGDPPADRKIPGAHLATLTAGLASIANQSQLDAVALRYPLATPSQWLTLFAQYHAKTGKPLDDLTKPNGTWSWLFGIIDPQTASDGPSVRANRDAGGLNLNRNDPALRYAAGRLRSSR